MSGLNVKTHIPAKESRQPTLFTSFCGFNKEIGFKANIIHEQSLKKTLLQSDLKDVWSIGEWNERVEKMVALYYDNIRFLAQNRNVDVIVCILSKDIYDLIAKGRN